MEEEIVTLEGNNQYKTSLKKWIELKNIYLKSNQWVNAVRCLNELADYHNMLLISLEEKKRYVEEALKISNKYLLNNSLEKARAFELKAEIYTFHGKYDSSIINLKVASSIFKETQEWEDFIWSNLILITNYYLINDNSKLNPLFSEIKQIYEEQQIENQDILNTYYNLYGVFCHAMKDYDQGIKITVKGLNILKNENSFDKLYNIYTLNNNLAVFHEYKGELNRSQFYYEICFNIANELSLDDSEMIDLYWNYGKTLFKLDKFPEAI